ncbi:histidine kinase sensor domain-containing protein [Shewanella eurypsychrophilus]|uniref:histidine kinase n=1 Tax=Shewanella eurypsychrophilus TaxID=2593656 RepID=A0ABX6V8P1_9GAMM|nr:MULTISPECIES: ATP-binding protein [Shewanella]QFU22622.1 HAMP domain-containing protein [Shewanella sp. YLB-09]QPG57911.1 histidine kinase sensor domain-containing protein [Shewanella eurypsychrophilus]
MFIPLSGLFSRLQVKIFSYFALSLLAILLIATGIERVVINRLLTLPGSTQAELTQLANQATELINAKDLLSLATWEKNQSFRVYVLDENLRSITQAEMHPHFIFKLQYMRQLHLPMGDSVRKPLIGIPLVNAINSASPLTLVVQLIPELHPAQKLTQSLWLIRLLVGISVLLVFTSILTRYLITPLTHLKKGTQALAGGQLDTRISQHFSVKETEFYHLATEFDYMAEQLQNAMQNQKRLLRDVSHELRTPLARQELALHLLSKQANEQQQKNLSRLEHENQQMASLINSILDYSRLNNAYVKLTLSSVPLNTIRTKVLKDIQFEAKDTQTISWNLAAVEVNIITDINFLIRAIDNILRNALKYAGNNCTVIISTRIDEETCIIDIEDDGLGISESELDNIFNPFTRMDEARHSSQGGYGLGLAIVKQSIKLLGGEVHARNVEQGGFCISLSLPLKPKHSGKTQVRTRKLSSSVC